MVADATTVLADERSEWFHARFEALLDALDGIVLGHRETLELVVATAFARGHLLLEDLPGSGKTTLAKAVAGLVRGTWRRIQFTPDLLPSDVTGSPIWNQRTQAFEFHPGPVFAHVVLIDEINRASPKTQSALLEVMEEGQVTADGVRYAVPDPHLVIGTQNPIEFDGTYRLPEAQLDRFLVRLSLGYPDDDDEVRVLTRGGAGPALEALQPVITPETWAAMADVAEELYVAEEIVRYVQRLARETRRLAEPRRGTAGVLRLGVSTRGALAVVRLARVVAAASGRTYVLPEDVQRVAAPVWAHRLSLDPEAEADGLTGESVVADCLRRVPVL